MTLSIDHANRLRALKATAGGNEPRQGLRLITLIRTVAVVAIVGGVGVLAAAFALNEWRTAVVGGGLLLVAALAGVVCVLDAMIADRGEFYRRGKLDGWMEGWRGQEPSAEDPLLKQ